MRTMMIYDTTYLSFAATYVEEESTRVSQTQLHITQRSSSEKRPHLISASRAEELNAFPGNK